MSLALFDLLFDSDKRRGRTFVIDRGIYSLATLQAFDPDYVITWEKGYRSGGWDDDAKTITFSRSLAKNSSGDLRTTRFQCQESRWRRDQSFRRIIVRVTAEVGERIELSVITTHPDMDIQDVVWAILRRWLQENDFKYLDVHFGINQLTSRDSSSFRESIEQFEDRPVDSPEYRELKTSLKDLETTLGRQLVQLRKMEKQSRQVDLEANKLDARGRRLLARLDKTLQRLKAGLPEPRGSRNIKQEAVEFRRARTVLRSKQKNNADKREKILGHIAVIEQRIEPLQAQLCDA